MTARKRSLTGKVAVLVISDTHTGSSIGLAPPLVHLDDGGIYHSSDAQRLVYEHWQGVWKRTLALGLPVVVIDNADTVEGFHHNTAQIWGTDPRKHIDVAVDLRMPYRNRVERWYALRGTVAHVGASGSGDEAVAKEIGADASNGTFSHYHLKVEISGVLFDITHHGISAGKPVLANTIWHILIPFCNLIGYFVKFVISKVAVPSKPASKKPAQCIFIPILPIELLP